MRLGLPSSTTTCNGKMPRELLRPRFETKVGNFIYRRKKKGQRKGKKEHYNNYIPAMLSSAGVSIPERPLEKKEPEMCV